MSFFERDELQHDAVIMLKDKPCRIIHALGSGTSSIVYQAAMPVCVGGITCERTVVLKELYPAGLDIKRKDDMSLNVPEISETYTNRFKEACKRQIDFHNHEKTTNFTTDLQDVYEANNTLYSVMGIVTGNSYDKERPETILSILNVGMCLADCISKYHEMGYLHLDIKPENIFKERLTGENIKIQLFDFDTVSNKKEVLNGEFSYSEGYEAPEVSGSYNGLFDFSDIDERADIYSIGAVIFKKIMGRVPDFSDQRNGRVWDLSSNRYLKDTVPQLQKGIMELFRKTLARKKENRYSSADELKNVLKNLINIADIKVFLKNQRISPCTPKDIYIPRKDVLSEIEKRLDEKHILYLHALGGSGKSETAREYAEQYADKYDYIQSVFYSGSLKKTIANLDFVGLKAEARYANTDEEINSLYDLKYNYYLGNTSLYGTNTLLIIDNYNPTSDEVIQNQGIISNLRDLHIHILFTTRVKPTDISECYDLENMFPEELRTLFFKINPTDKDKSERIKLVDEIIKLSYNHTMTVKLVAMQSAEYMKPLEEYRNVLQEKGLNSGFESEIINEKDGRLVVEDSVYNHIRALFKLNDLKPKQKYIMVNACLLPLSGLEASTFSQYIDLAHFESSSSSVFRDPEIKKLVNSGWIEYADTSEESFTAETKITLHPLICDIVKNELKPEMTEGKCGKFYEAFLNLIDEWGNLKAGGKDYLQQENMVYELFPNIFEIYEDRHILAAINFIALSDIKISVRNHIISSDNKIILYFGNEKQLELPDGVTEIGYSAFSDRSFLTHITIPDSVTKIGDSAFSGCSSLTHITIPDSVTKIGDSAFSDCSSLAHITIPDSVTKIGDSAFSGCSYLAHITIPDSVIEIGDSAFKNCWALTKIIIPNSVTKIGDYTFLDCQSLTHITIPNSVTKIGNYAFAYCSDLKDIDLPENVKCGVGTFDGCISLKKFSKPHRYLTELVIPNGVTEIKDHTFEDCIVLGKIIIPDSVTKIGNSAFKNFCSSSPIIIPESIKKIGDNAFESCLSLEQITITGNVTKIGNYAFSDCSNLKHIIISNGVTKIGRSTFYGCAVLEVNIPDSVTKIGKRAFAHCSSLMKISISHSVTEIKRGVFSGCSSLEQITIPNSVNKIGDSAFVGCRSLTEIIIPSSVTKIENYAFRECLNLTHITIPDNVTKIGNGAFIGCSALKEITIPDSVTKIGWGAFVACSVLKEIIIPDNVTKIGKKSFAECNSLSCVVVMNPTLDLSESMIEYYFDKNGLCRKKDKLILKGYKNSTAEQYAQKHGFLFVSLD